MKTDNGHKKFSIKFFEDQMERQVKEDDHFVNRFTKSHTKWACHGKSLNLIHNPYLVAH